MKLSIIIPVFNEKKTVKELINKVLNVSLPNNMEKEIIVINDGSTDNSERIIKGFRKNEFKYFKHSQNLGKGAAIKTGLKYSKGDFIIIQDADLEYDPKDYTRLLKPILEGRAKVVSGTRLINYPLRLWGKNKTVLPVHLIANKFLTGLVNFLYGSKLTDMETCYKLFAKEVLEKIHLKSNRFEIEVEITAKILKLGYNIFEVPINVKPRTYDEGKKIGFLDGLKAIWTIFWFRFFN